MASLPPRPASQRRSSPPDESASAQHEQPARSTSFSATSEDSQTILLNSPRSHSFTDKPAEQTQGQTPPTTDATATTTSVLQEEDELRKCWICFNDESEDDETTSEWRSPCPCVLVAHEKCLLDWVADLEAPNARRRAGGRDGKILCPQCKSEIRLQRPRSLVVDLVRVVEKTASLALLPGAVTFAGTAAYTTLALIGRSQIYQIFGEEDAVQILAPLYRAPNLHQRWGALNEILEHWRLYVGLPLVPLSLMLSRSTIADSFLPFLPLIFFVSSGGSKDDLLQFSWPPSAAFTIASLPYIRGMYNAYYERMWLPREQRWLKEIQPRAGADSEPAALEIQFGEGDPHGHDHDHDDGDFDDDDEILNVEVDFDIFADWNNGGAADNNLAGENPPVPIARGPGAPFGEEEDDDEVPQLVPADELFNAAPAPNIPQQPQAPRRRVRRERAGFNTGNLADSILGAVLFPSIAAAVGEALRFALPKSLVTTQAGKPAGFLQTKWGRSILGGCLFVGVKDAVILYVRWKMAQNHRHRRVLDYDKSKGKSKKAPSNARS